MSAFGKCIRNQLSKSASSISVIQKVLCFQGGDASTLMDVRGIAEDESINDIEVVEMSHNRIRSLEVRSYLTLFYIQLGILHFHRYIIPQSLGESDWNDGRNRSDEQSATYQSII
jgi:hypothetical protein